jgi:hypothetical protein
MQRRVEEECILAIDLDSLTNAMLRVYLKKLLDVIMKRV